MRPVKRFLMIVGLVPALATAQAPASPTWPLDSGSKIRVLSPTFGRRSGTVLATKADTLTFLAHPDAIAVAVPAPKIVKLEVLRGSRTYVGKGILLGLLLGAGVGAVLGAATYSPPKSCADFCLDFGRGGSAAAGAVVIGVGGALVGMVVGAAGHEKWQTVRVPGGP